LAGLTTSVGESWHADLCAASRAPKGQPPRNLSGTKDHRSEAALEA
jgi:hypothetical protein